MAINDSDNSFHSFSSSTEVHSNDSSFHSLPSLSDNLESHFRDVSKNLNIVHINAQSIPAHYPDLLSTFQSSNVHAILVSESWLKPCLHSTSYSLPGFHLIRSDRMGRPGGGVAIYLRPYIPYTIISNSISCDGHGPDHLFVEITLSHTKLLLGVYYNPSLTVDYFASFENLLEMYTPLYSHTVVMGDFNTCLLKRDGRSSRLYSLVNSVNMHILPLQATHYLPNCAPSLLDLILVSSPDHVEKHGQSSANAFSYHDLIFLSYKLKPPRAKSRILLQRNFGGMDLDRLREDAAGIDWSTVFNASGVDEKISNFNSLLIKLFDIHAPIRPVRIKHLPAPWLTDEIKALQEQRNRAKARYKSDPNSQNLERYKKVRNRCNMACRDAQRRHIHKSVLEEADCAKSMYLLSAPMLWAVTPLAEK
ncbi:uncharacterized protein LOC123661236 [Melitaea cinxia]|uniref:uncharacterized protein LOC123661236 n=1 Tax=Melitaea cinxia TaxID=113334 RepID=UPI001E270537|nr:uncharacterized protein LOC123661236 [Melitaea cinxia]